MILNEGGNIWPETTDYDQTVEMIDGLVGATEDLIRETGLQIFVIGSSANPTQNVYIDNQLVGIFRERQKKFIPLDKFKDKYLPGHLPDGAKLIPKKSGDLDVMVDGKDAAAFFNTKDSKSTRQALDNLLQQVGVKTRKAGVTVHTCVPYQDKFYQVDIKVVDKAERVSKFHHHEIPPGSPWKGVNKQMMMNTLASSQGLLWSPDEGLYKRDAAGKKGEFLTDELDDIAKYLLGPQAGASDLGSVESIMAAIPDEAKRNDIFAKAKASSSWQAATPDVGTNEWFVRLKRMLS
jgi:hypothetical protein